MNSISFASVNDDKLYSVTVAVALLLYGRVGFVVIPVSTPISIMNS